MAKKHLSSEPALTSVSPSVRSRSYSSKHSKAVSAPVPESTIEATTAAVLYDHDAIARQHLPQRADANARGKAHLIVFGCGERALKIASWPSSGRKTYLMPWDADYARATIRPGRGDRWFCGEQEAQTAGFKSSVRVSAK